MGYFWLAIAIVSEVTATLFLPACKGFTRVWPSLACATSYGLSFYFLSLVLNSVPVGVTYAIWSGAGIVLVGILGAYFYKQIPDVPAMIGMGLIIAGVAVMNLFSKTISH
ncbi:QacE family quaternary ammonium compound efflux SMR transporter [Pseudodesulfovibrio nedwellii]|uniref:QacE family quaternary ammonium compound efflux SMR transporter n=2 Tax=Pseudodesulfovibrio nedwellii TaxID=2973072 RepID=A0ABM8B4W7_9BACT|nr:MULTISPECIES: multidrug efflux SMR transporter [Pseudodesulfovibrio]BDQ38895.1 QacE family quaternary ammonium compound efflux SMR transporter [Pseudodesulfovibrio nedwellii]